MDRRPAPLTAKFELAKQAADLCTGGLDQRIVLDLYRKGILEGQGPLLRAHYQQKRDVMTHALRNELQGVVEWPVPRGGFFLWVTLRSNSARMRWSRGHWSSV